MKPAQEERAGPAAGWSPPSGRALAFGEPFVVQWHLHDACNLACRHCYREPESRPSLGPQARRAVLLGIHAFLARLGVPGRLHLAGGEPTACGQLPEIVAEARRLGIRCRILSNGTLMNPDLAAHLARHECLGVQVSVEGPREIHDALRGTGSFEAALHGVAILKAAGVPTTLAMTLHGENLAHLEEVARLAREHADRVYYSRLVPTGRGATLDPGLEPGPWNTVQKRILALARTQPVALRDPTFRPHFAAPWHARKAPVVAGCAAGWRCLAIESDGTVYPCRRLAVPLGNVLQDDLLELWRRHPFLGRLRDRDALEGACGRCAYRWVCGGCRAIPYAVHGQPFGEDPVCPWTRPALRLRHAAGHLLRAAAERLPSRTFP